MTEVGPIGLARHAPEEATGQDAAKYSSTNPVVQRLLGRWLTTVAEVVGPDPGRHGDVGVGEGLSLEKILPPGHRAVGFEYRLGKLQAARHHVPGLRPLVADAGMLPVADHSFDTVTCLEVLEHLDPMEPAIDELARITRQRCIVSVPFEPWFRLGNLVRGKHPGRIGNDPEHVQHFGRRSLTRALAARFPRVETQVVFPWLVAVAYVDGRGVRGQQFLTLDGDRR